MPGYRIVNIENLPEFARALNMSDRSPDKFLESHPEYFGKWHLRFSQDGRYGTAHRVALKTGHEGPVGINHLHIVHFAAPIARKDERVSVDFIENVCLQLLDLIEATAVLTGERLGTSVSSTYLTCLII